MSKNIQQGRNSFIGFSKCSGTAEVASTGPAEFILVSSFAFKREAPEILIPELNKNRATKRHVEGDVSANGTFEKTMDLQNGVGLYQYLITGSLTSASNTGKTYTHTFAEDTDTKDTGDVTRLQFMVSPGGGSSSSRNWFNGVVDSYSLNVAPGGIPKETWNLKFSNHGSVLNTAPTLATTDTPPINYTKCIIKLGASISACSAVAVREVGLTINNNVQENREIGTNTVENFSMGNRDITGNFTLIFESQTLYNDYLNKTSTAMQIYLEGSSPENTLNDPSTTTNHYLQFNLPEVIFTGETPAVSGPDQILQPIQFTAIYGSNAAYQIRVLLVNSQATLAY